MPFSDPWLPPGAPIGMDAAVFEVYRYDPEAEEEEDRLTLLPAVQVWRIETREGTDPGSCWLGYAFGTADPESPQAMEEALSTGVTLEHVIREGDRIVVRAYRPGWEGVYNVVFDGLAVGFSVRLDPGAEEVPIVCVGIAKRLWDADIGGAFQRYSSHPEGIDPGQTVATDLPARFNPEGLANATGADHDFAPDPDPGEPYPVFIDPHAKLDEPDQRRPWTLAMAARYLIWRHNPGEEFVKNPTGAELDELLVAHVPDSLLDYDPADPDTFEVADIVVPDAPLTGRDWPGVLYELIRAHGFGMHFTLDTLEDGTPETKLVLFRQQGGATLDLWLQPRGAALDLTLTNTQALEIGRDIGDVVNAWQVDGHLERTELSIVLAPGFPSDPDDCATYSDIAAFDQSDDDYRSGANRDKYRLYVADEAGEGHYAAGSDTEVTMPTSLNAALNPDDVDGRDPVTRRRPPAGGRLFSLDPRGRPLEARLAISTDYAGDKPGLWDGTGTWQPVHGGWQLLRDRLGIWITIDNPNRWHIGASDATGHPYRTGVVRGVEAQAKAGATRFHLRLTCVVEGDFTLRAVAGRRSESPIPREIRRRVDARDRYFLDRIAPNSEFNETEDAVVVRDDTEDAQSEAASMRWATQSGVLEGPATIPWFTGAYGIGDRIRSVQGRGLGLRTNGGAGLAAARYPVVVGITWETRGRQSTRLELSDAGTERRALERRIHPRADQL